MALDIPLPGSFGEAYRKGSETGSTMLARMMQAQQAKNELAETSRYHTGQLGIQQGELGVRQKQLDINARHAAVAEKAEGRAQQLMPYLVEKYKDEHGEAASKAHMKKMYDAIIEDTYKSEYPDLFPGHAQEAHQAAMTARQASQPQEEGPNTQPESPIGRMTPTQKIPNFGEQPQKRQTPVEFSNPPQPQGTPWAPYVPPQEVQAHEQMQPQAPQMPGFSPIPQEAQQTPETVTSKLRQLEAQGQLPKPIADKINEKEALDEQAKNGKVIFTGDPKRYRMDKLAGLPGFPAIKQTPRPNNMMDLTYPSGKIVEVQGTPPKEKGANAPLTATEKKEVFKMQESGRALQSLVNRAEGIKKVLTVHPEATGKIAGGRELFNLSNDKNLAAVIPKMKALQADMARFGSTRGGAYALKWAERAKPSTFRSGEFNISMIDSIVEDAKNDYDELAGEYKEMTGKDYPIKFPENESAKKSETEAPQEKTINGKTYKLINNEWHMKKD